MLTATGRQARRLGVRSLFFRLGGKDDSNALCHADGKFYAVFGGAGVLGDFSIFIHKRLDNFPTIGRGPVRPDASDGKQNTHHYISAGMHSAIASPNAHDAGDFAVFVQRKQCAVKF